MTCTVCRHGQRLEIEKALLSGAPHRSVAKRFGATSSAVFRHLKGHLGPRLARAQAAHDAATDRAARAEVTRESWSAEALVRKILSLGTEAEAILAEAKQGKDHDLALRAIGRASVLLELQGKAAAAMQGASAGCPTCSARGALLDDERLAALIAKAARRIPAPEVSPIDTTLVGGSGRLLPVPEAVSGGKGR